MKVKCACGCGREFVRVVPWKKYATPYCKVKAYRKRQRKLGATA